MDPPISPSKSNKLHRLLFESPYNNGPLTPNRNLPFWLWQSLVLSIRMITPVSYVYIGYLALRYNFDMSNYLKSLGRQPFSSPMNYLTAWAAAEVVFFPYYYYLYSKFHNLNENLEHYALTPDKRKEFVRNCFEALKTAASNPNEAHLYVRKAMEGYFKNVPVEQIPISNFTEWLSWAFFGKHLEDLTPDESAENLEYVSYIEKEMKYKFKEDAKYDSNLPSLRVSLDPVFATQRPLAFYITIMAYNYASHAIVYLLGFRKREKYNAGDQSIYYRPASAAPNKLEGKEALPIVFFHGIGIGFATYLTMIFSFPREVDIYMVEWPFVAMQPSFNVPTSGQVIDSVVSILDDDNHIHACFIAHSLGTSAVAWMLRNPKGAKKVAATVLLDPVVYLMCDPTVAINFVHKEPATVEDYKMHFFVSRELFIANTLSRHFSWSKNIVFTEDLEEASRQRMLRDGESLNNSKTFSRIDHLIVISKADHIIPVKPITRYLEKKLSEASETHGNCFELVALDGLSHGDMFGSMKHVRFVSQKIRQICGLSIVAK